MTKAMPGVSSSSSKEVLLRLLPPLSTDILKEFIHRCIDDLCGRKGPLAEKFCTPCCWAPEQFTEAVISMKMFVVDCTVNSHDRKQVEEGLPLQESHISCFMNCLTVRGDELRNFLLLKLQNGTSEVLSDHDWKIKWIMGSSSLSSLQETLLELDLTTMKAGTLSLVKNVSCQQGRISIELTRDNVNNLISVLEKAQESV